MYLSAEIKVYTRIPSPSHRSHYPERLLCSLIPPLLALGVVVVLLLASVSSRASGGAGVAVAAALSPASSRSLNGTRGSSSGGAGGSLGVVAAVLAPHAGDESGGRSGSGSRDTGSRGDSRGRGGRLAGGGLTGSRGRARRLGGGSLGGSSSGGGRGSAGGDGGGGGSGGSTTGGGEKAGDGGVGGLGLEVLVPGKSLTGAGEDRGNPGVLVGVVPDADANTLGDVEASTNNADVVGGLLFLSGGIGGDALVADVELGVGDLGDTGVDVGLENGAQGRAGASAADDQMGLKTDTIDLGTGILDALDDVENLLLLVASQLDVVVVVVKLGISISRGGGLERDGNEVSTEDLVEDTVAVGAVLVKGLVDDIPGVALALVVAGNVGDVRLNDGGQLLLGPGTRGDPGGKLRVPDQSVAAQKHAVVLGEGGDLVAGGVAEDALALLGELPLLTVTGGNGTEHLVVLEDRDVFGVGQLRVVSGGTEVLLAGGLGQFVEVGADASGEQAGCGEGGETHLGESWKRETEIERDW